MNEIIKDFQALEEVINQLHEKWIMHQQLFKHSQPQQRIDLLIKCAPKFFYTVSFVLFSDVVITFCKLTDPATEYGHDNLSLEQLQARVEGHDGDPVFLLKLCKILKELEQKCDPFRTWRNKLYVHSDHRTIMQSMSYPLPIISPKMVEDALALLREYMKTIAGRYFPQKEFVYDEILEISRKDCEALVSMLKKGLRYDELVKQNKIRSEDLSESKWKDA